MTLRLKAESTNYMSPVSSVFHTEITMNIGLKNTVRVGASIPSIRCLCYKPGRFRLSLSPQNKQSQNCYAHALPSFFFKIEKF